MASELTKPFEEKMKRLTNNLYNIMNESQKIDNEIVLQLTKMGWNQNFKED